MKGFKNPLSVVNTMENEKYKKVHGRLWYAIRSGKFKDKKVKCEICNSTKNLVYHHNNYLKPYEVEIICRRCHGKRHKVYRNFKEAYKKEKRNKFGRFGDEKPIEIIICQKCKKKTEKQNPKQKYCFKCMIKLNTRHLSKKKMQMKNDKQRYFPIM